MKWYIYHLNSTVAYDKNDQKSQIVNLDMLYLTKV